MLSFNAVKNEYHEATKHSLRSIAIDPNYVDARTQPASFKIYPKFFRRFPLSLHHPIHQFISLTSAITYQKQYRDSVHLLRVQPSAGALYPTELYVQLRGISGMVDGIYHVEPEQSFLTLIYELIDDGVESYLNDSRLIKGCIFLVSCVYFRSSWKYKNRSLRYCFLDSGHHLGAIEAAAYVSNYSYRLLFDFDQAALNDDFGFEHKEFFTAAVVVGEPKQKTVRRLRSPLPVVAGTDYFEPNRFVEAGYKQTITFPAAASEAVQIHSPIYSPTHSPADSLAYSPKDLLIDSLTQPTFPVELAQWLNAIQQRRSARRFYPHSISSDAFLKICAALQQPIPGDSLETIEIYVVVQRVTGLQPGLYRDVFSDSRHCLKAGAFHAETGYLCINQAIARDSAAVFFFVSNCRNYRVALQQAGLIGQRIYLAATALNLGCSGIGAFYDDETQAFLGTDRMVLYAMAIGELVSQSSS